MKKQEMRRLLALVGRLTRGQRQELVDKLKTQSKAEASIEVLESAGCQVRACAHCKSDRLVRNGMADGLQRYKCQGFHEFCRLYAIIIVDSVILTVSSLLQIDEINAPVWGAVVNGVIAAPTWSR